MSLQHLLADPAVHAEPQTSFCRKCSQPMRIATAAPGRNEDEARVYECDCGHQAAINPSRRPVEPKKLEPSVQDAMLAAVPSLRAFAMSLSGKFDRADDLVQTTLLRAIANIHSFTPGTNMSAWLFTIPPQPVPVGISQATPRSRRCGRRLRCRLEVVSRAVQPPGVQGALRCACKVAARTARGAAVGRCVGLLLRRRRRDLWDRGGDDKGSC
jgi:hypothetical protein